MNNKFYNKKSPISKILKKKDSDIINSKIPLFGLKKMKEFDLDIFKKAKRDTLEAFILSLAISFNDCKDALWYYEMLEQNIPKNKNEISEESGQWRGMKGYALKQVISIIYETLNLLGNNIKIINGLQFNEIEKHLNRNELASWKKLKDYLNNENDFIDKKTTNFLFYVRNKISSHYDVVDNLNSFKNIANSCSMNGYVSLGSSLEQSRFYFADMCFDKHLNQIKDEKLNLKSVLEKINIPIRNIIEVYLKLKCLV